MRSISLAAIAIAALALSAVRAPVPHVVWNASASAPIGLYWVTNKAAERGELALVKTPESIRTLAAERGYIPIGVPLVKRIVAQSGDDVCAQGGRIRINGRVVADTRATDSQGRQMPVWSGCRTLSEEVFLLMSDVPASFDSRYFGPVPVAAVIGTLTPLWTR